ncbi:hypothetical protein ALP39_200233 [Pseudomonas marginalis pv. marginalis]|uniref:hypothetical protein n=1 Tax=Pseudomonas fluorescens TaxID=294 RepID=UPI000EFF96BC|nr:hypothetical protein [Pseudomonas fluorescens]MBD8239521.1 hypothetical protein [Pseudomonas fluorescens]MDY0898434.1 hypothetical protein [Pseudomonas fluorescens]RMT95088.1 hypothetical protein ALP39_200233 [Pseudomonas marginalis pv. marginalis]
MNLRDQIHQHAVALIRKAYPHLAIEVECAPEVELCGMSRTEYLDLRISEALGRQAKLQSMHVWDYQLMLAERAGIDVAAIRDEDLRTEVDALGVNALI